MKILIITNLEHSSPRIPGLVKYLDKKEWEPIIVCPPLRKDFGKSFGPNKELMNSNVRIIRTGKRIPPRIENDSKLGIIRNKVAKHAALFNILRKIYYVYHSFKYYPDRDYSWKKYAFNSINKLLNKEKIDLVLSSSSPVTTHIIASKIKKEYGIPWVADLRDLWTLNHNYTFSNIRKYFERKLEKRTLKNADEIIVAAHPFEKLVDKLHQIKSITITNGYDPAYYSTKKISDKKKFSICYVGNVFYHKQNLDEFFLALRNLIEKKELDKEKIEVSFYGPTLGWIEKKISDFQLENIVIQKGHVPREEAYARQQTASILLLLNWNISNDTHYPLKLFEYLGAKRPILSVGGKQSNKVNKIIQDAHAGQFYSSVKQIETAIKKYYQEQMTKGQCTYHGINKEIEKYSYKNMAKSFSDVFSITIKKSARQAIQKGENLKCD